MDCVELVSRNGWIILIILAIIGLFGVGLHVWWSSRLSFFRFDKADTRNKGNLKRLLYPLIPVSLLSLFTPILAIILSAEFRSCLEDPKIVPFLSRMWVYVLPVVGTGVGVSSAACIFIGNIAYWGVGLILFLITRTRG